MDLKAVPHDALATAYDKAREKPPASQYTQNRLIMPGSATVIRDYELEGLLESFRTHANMHVTWEVKLPSYGGAINSNGRALMPESTPAEIKFYHTQTIHQKHNMSSAAKYSIVLNLIFILLYFILPLLRN